VTCVAVLEFTGSGLESEPNLDPGGHDVESISRKLLIELRKRVADSKHGFESRWGHQIVFVDVLWLRV